MGLKTSLFAASIFLLGHFMADLGWYTFVSTAISRGKSLMSEGTYQRVIMVCGGFFDGVRGVVYGESGGSVLDNPELDVYIIKLLLAGRAHLKVQFL